MTDIDNWPIGMLAHAIVGASTILPVRKVNEALRALHDSAVSDAVAEALRQMRAEQAVAPPHDMNGHKFISDDNGLPASHCVKCGVVYKDALILACVQPQPATGARERLRLALEDWRNTWEDPPTPGTALHGLIGAAEAVLAEPPPWPDGMRKREEAIKERDTARAELAALQTARDRLLQWCMGELERCPQPPADLRAAAQWRGATIAFRSVVQDIHRHFALGRSPWVCPTDDLPPLPSGAQPQPEPSPDRRAWRERVQTWVDNSGRNDPKVLRELLDEPLGWPDDGAALHGAPPAGKEAT